MFCPLLGARSLQSSYDRKAAYQEVKELSATTRLSSLSSTNLPERDSLLVVEHEMGNLPLHFEGWAEDDVSLAEGLCFCRLEEIDPFALGVGATHSSSDEMRT